MNFVYKLGTLSACWLLAAACGSDGDADSSGGAAGAAGAVGGPCTPGTTQACTGADSCSGIQTCNTEGTGYGACDCDPGAGGAGTGGGGATGGGTIPPPIGIECTNPADAGSFTFSEIAVWRDGATAAYTMYHDDLCDWGCVGIQENAVPALEAHGLAAGAGAIVSECEANGLWDMVADLEARGMEIMSHSINHPEITVDNAPVELVQSKATLESHLVNPVTFFIFPYDAFSPDTIAAVGAAGYIGSRAGSHADNDGLNNPPVNPVAPTNDLEIEYGGWPHQYSMYTRYTSPGYLKAYIWDAIARGAWATSEFHSVAADGAPEGGNGFGPIYLSDYNDLLDFLVDAWWSNQVWTAPPSTVIKYRRARSACGASVSGSTITYDTSAADCTAYATPISVIVTTENDVPSVQALQDGAPVQARKIGPNTFSINADPTQGSVELSGCADPDPAEVDSSIQLEPKPEPADSVCDVTQVVATGSPGNMDDLEMTDPGEFQAFPNPRQADGRDGSWTWYPLSDTSVNVEEDPLEPGNHAVHFATSSGGVDEWAGISLAFLGGSGAGTCYDASAYNGVRFRIRGTVSADNENWGADTVAISLVAAATQPMNWGGDAEEQIGHFHSMVNMSSAADAWITVDIPFDDTLLPPWSGQGPATIPKDQLQSINWGFSPGQDFDIWIDDIELY